MAMDGLEKEIPELVRIEPVLVEAMVNKLEPHLIGANVHQTTTATLTCSRCLTPFAFPVDTHWSERFTDEEHRAIDTEEEQVHLIEGQVLDLTPYIRESILLQLPYAPVCREECKGLCPKCGINRNEAACDCRTERIDPRLAALEEWFKKQDD
jgi:uncharacterized protein